MTDQLSPFYDKKITCPLCENIFESKRVRSRFVIPLKSDSDFCTYYKNEQHSPLLYVVNVCVECGYSFSDDFSSYFPPGTSMLIKDTITSKWSRQDFGQIRTLNDAIKTYKLAMLTANLKQEKRVVRAGLAMRLSWIYRKMGQASHEERFLRITADEYEKSYLCGDHEEAEMSEVRVLYLIGELSRRLKQHKKAVQYFSKATEFKNSTIEKRIVEMAREQWMDMRNDMKNG